MWKDKTRDHQSKRNLKKKLYVSLIIAPGAMKTCTGQFAEVGNMRGFPMLEEAFREVMLSKLTRRWDLALWPVQLVQPCLVEF